MKLKTWLTAALLIAPLGVHAAPEDRKALFGETHLHTNLSFDAFIFGNRNGPDEAYEFAKGAECGGAVCGCSIERNH